MNAKTNCMLASALCAGALGAAVPDVTSVTMSQDLSREVTITYTLTNAPAVITLDIQTNATDGSWTTIGGKNIQCFSSDSAVWKRIDEDGTYTIKWHPDQSWPDHKIPEGGARAVVTAWALDNTPDYMVVDISDTATANSQTYYPGADYLPLGAVGNPAYRTTCLLLRKIMAKNVKWYMGSVGEGGGTDEKTHDVTLANNYYIGVFPVTQTQWALVNAGNPWPSAYKGADRAMRPVENICYNEIRRANCQTEMQGGAWPDPPWTGSFLARLNSKTGLTFEMPSEAQWEYACRAGNGDGKWGNGAPISDKTLPGSFGKSDPEDVGSYEPNSWGLYDMHGGVWEWCLDSYGEDISGLHGAVNTTGAKKVIRGGSYMSGYASCRSAKRNSANSNDRQSYYGFRVCCQAGLK